MKIQNSQYECLDKNTGIEYYDLIYNNVKNKVTQKSKWVKS